MDISAQYMPEHQKSSRHEMAIIGCSTTTAINDSAISLVLADQGAMNSHSLMYMAGARDVRLKSNTFIPALVGGLDPRSLGVSLAGLTFSGSSGAPRVVSLDDERLQDGFHAEESKSSSPWRWTNGEVVLSPDFWEGLSGHVALLVTCTNAATRQWVAPAKPEQEARPRLYAVRARKFRPAANRRLRL